MTKGAAEAAPSPFCTFGLSAAAAAAVVVIAAVVAAITAAASAVADTAEAVTAAAPENNNDENDNPPAVVSTKSRIVTVTHKKFPPISDFITSYGEKAWAVPHCRKFF